MVALRTRALGAFSFAPFWLSAFGAALAPTTIGYQDLAALLARQSGVSERWREHLIGSPFGTIHAATFSFARPIGTDLPEPTGVEPVNYDPRSLDVKVWSADAAPMARPQLDVEYPAVNRRLKGDRLPLPPPAPPASEPEILPQLQPIDAPAPTLAPPPPRPPAPHGAPRLKNAEQPDAAPPAARANAEAALPISQMSAAPTEHADAPDADVEDDLSLADRPPEIPAAGENGAPGAAPSSFDAFSFLDEQPAERNAQLYFSVATMGSTGGLQEWEPGAAPVLVSRAVDANIKLSALAGIDSGTEGETVAGKDDAGRLESPAVRLGLTGKPRARAEKCLADAVYFEARGEPLRGQMAVAQVVMNRVFSGYYPNNVCGVVYQNANRHLACQFTFACEGKDLSRIDELDMWAQAKRIAKDTLDGKIWLVEVGHATHYHAYWVHPSWVHEMKKMYKLGVHTFYRPRAGGDGSDAPNWAPVAAKPAGAAAPIPEAAKSSATGAKSPDAAAKIPEAAASPADLAGSKTARTAKL